MKTTCSTNRILGTLLDTVGLKGEYRTPEQLREHYEIEKELATKLRESSHEERRALYASLYEELYQLVPSHSQLAQQPSSKDPTGMRSPNGDFFAASCGEIQCS